MFRELKENLSYSKAISFFSVLGALFGILTGAFGELFLPLAVPFMACLFIFEKPERRFMSYIVSASVLVISYFLSGINAITALEAVVLAVLVAFLYTRKISKSETAFYMTVITTVFIIASLYIGAALQINSFSPQEVQDFYAEAVQSLKSMITEYASSYLASLESADKNLVITDEMIDIYFTALINSAISLIVVAAFLISGISMKIFCAVMRRCCKYGILKKFSHFGVNNVISYFYILIALLSFIVSNQTALDIAILNIDIVLVVVFAYIGIKYLLSLAEFTGRRSLIYTLIAASFLLMGASALRIVSYIGVFINISINRSAAQFNSDSNKNSGQ